MEEFKSRKEKDCFMNNTKDLKSCKQYAHEAGFSSLKKMLGTIGESRQTLNNWKKNKPFVFKAVISYAKTKSKHKYKVHQSGESINIGCFFLNDEIIYLKIHRNYLEMTKEGSLAVFNPTHEDISKMRLTQVVLENGSIEIRKGASAYQEIESILDSYKS